MISKGVSMTTGIVLLSVRFMARSCATSSAMDVESDCIVNPNLMLVTPLLGWMGRREGTNRIAYNWEIYNISQDNKT